MTKAELIKALRDDPSPDDTEIYIRTPAEADGDIASADKISLIHKYHSVYYILID